MKRCFLVTQHFNKPEGNYRTISCHVKVTAHSHDIDWCTAQNLPPLLQTGFSVAQEADSV